MSTANGPQVFTGPKPGQTATVQYMGTVPMGSTPANGDATWQILYKVNGKILQMPSTAPAPPLGLYWGRVGKQFDATPPSTQLINKPIEDSKPSTGGVYVAPSGIQVQVSAGVPVPAAWTQVSPIIETGQANHILQSPFLNEVQLLAVQQSGNIRDAYLSSGGFYQNPTGGAIVQVPEGEAVPAAWINVGDMITDEQAANAIVMPTFNLPASGSTPIVDTAIKIIAIGGVAVIAYVGYLFVYKPHELQDYITRLKNIKDLAVNSVYIVAAVALLAGLSFIGYKFSEAYEEQESVGGAIGQLIADAVVFSVDIFVTTFKELALGLWDWFKTEITDLFSGGLFGL